MRSKSSFSLTYLGEGKKYELYSKSGWSLGPWRNPWWLCYLMCHCVSVLIFHFSIPFCDYFRSRQCLFLVIPQPSARALPLCMEHISVWVTMDWVAPNARHPICRAPSTSRTLGETTRWLVPFVQIEVFHHHLPSCVHSLLLVCFCVSPQFCFLTYLYLFPCWLPSVHENSFAS